MPFSVRPIYFKPWKKRLRIVKKLDVQKVGFHEKSHISENMSPTDLRQVSKFSLGQYLRLLPWHPKDLVGRKIFLGESKITSFIFIICVYLAGFKMNGFHRKWHNLVIMCPSDLGQGSKFSLIQDLKLFLWHPKDLTSIKNILGEQKLFETKNVGFFVHTLYISYLSCICPSFILSIHCQFQNMKFSLGKFCDKKEV